MMSTKIHTRVIEQTFVKTGTTMPAPVADVIAKAARVRDQLDKLTRAQANISEAVAAALMAGKDPLTDPTVKRSVITTALVNSNATDVVQNVIDLEIRQTYTDQIDAILAAWREAFDTSAATMRAACASLGDVALSDTDAVVRMGPGATKAWSGATTANDTIAAINDGWHSLIELTRAASIDNRHRILRMADVPYVTWQQHELTGRKLAPWDATRLGLTLSLPTPAEYAARVRSILAGDAGAEHERGEAFKDAIGRRRDSIVKQVFAQRAGAVQ